LLLVVASLFVRSMQVLMQTDVGYARDQLLVARMDVRSLGYSDEQRQLLYDRVLERVRGLPGVVSVSASLNGPMGNSQRNGSLAVEGYTPGAGETLSTNSEIVTLDYFDTVGLRLIEGRGWTPNEARPGNGASIINESMARRFFPEGNALGKRWTWGDDIAADSPTIIGVVQDAKYRDVRTPTPNMIYQLAAATPDNVLGNLEIRTAGAPAALADSVRQVLLDVEPALPVFDVVPLESRLNRGLANDRLIANLTTAFGIAALLLACLGLYGTIAYGVARRIAELGVRMALGADRNAVLWLVIREALTLVLIGAAVGVPLAYAAGRSIVSLLHGVGALDGVAYTQAAVTLLVVGALAAYVPAYRASRTDPMTALRSE
jgi:putative ABC transport system permease protein